MMDMFNLFNDYTYLLHDIYIVNGDNIVEYNLSLISESLENSINYIKEEFTV